MQFPTNGSVFMTIMKTEARQSDDSRSVIAERRLGMRIADKCCVNTVTGTMGNLSSQHRSAIFYVAAPSTHSTPASTRTASSWEEPAASRGSLLRLLDDGGLFKSVSSPSDQ